MYHFFGVLYMHNLFFVFAWLTETHLHPSFAKAIFLWRIATFTWHCPLPASFGMILFLCELSHEKNTLLEGNFSVIFNESQTQFRNVLNEFQTFNRGKTDWYCLIYFRRKKNAVRVKLTRQIKTQRLYWCTMTDSNNAAWQYVMYNGAFVFMHVLCIRP